MYTPNKQASTHVKQKLTELKRRERLFAITIGDFSTPFSVTDITNRENITRDIAEYQSMDLNDI